MAAFYYVLILLVPLLYSNLFIQSFELPKIIAFYLVTELLTIFVLIKNRKLFTKFDIWDYLALGYLGIAIISSVAAGNIEHSFLGGPYRFQGILTIFHLVVLFIVTRRVRPKNLNKLFVYTGVIQSIVLIFQFIEINFLNLSITNYAGRVVGTMGQPGFVAGFLVAGLGFSLGGNKLLTALILIGILSTQSLGGILGIIILVPVYFLKIKSSKLFLLPLLVLLLIVGIVGLKKEKITLDEMRTPRVESRLSIWPTSFRLFLERPFAGYGVENLAYVFPPEFGGSSIDRAHNVLLDNLLSGGVLMGGIYLILIFKGLSNTWRKKESLHIFLALLGVVVCDQVNVPGIVNLIAFWLILGLAI